MAFRANRPFFTILNSTPKLYYLFRFFFLIMIHTMLLPKMAPAFAHGRLIFGNISYFAQNISFPVFSLSSKHRKLSKRDIEKKTGTVMKYTIWIFITKMGRYVQYSSNWILSNLTVMVKNEEAENRNLSSTTCPQILEEQSFGVHTDKSPKIFTHVERIFLFKAGLSLNIDVAVSFFKSTKNAKTVYPFRTQLGWRNLAPINIFRPKEKNDRYFADHILSAFSWMKNVFSLIQISLKFIESNRQEFSIGLGNGLVSKMGKPITEPIYWHIYT